MEMKTTLRRFIDQIKYAKSSNPNTGVLVVL